MHFYEENISPMVDELLNSINNTPVSTPETDVYFRAFFDGIKIGLAMIWQAILYIWYHYPILIILVCIVIFIRIFLNIKRFIKNFKD